MKIKFCQFDLKAIVMLKQIKYGYDFQLIYFIAHPYFFIDTNWLPVRKKLNQ